MGRFMNCAACQLAAKGVKTRVAVEHTCGRYGKGWQAPQSKNLTGTVFAEGTYYRVDITDRIKQTGKATLWRLCRQWVNGWKTPTGTEIWCPDYYHFAADYSQVNTRRPEKYIWVHETIYNKLSFKS